MCATFIRRIYYGEPGRFEQSLDVYVPARRPAGPLPLVILVVGSGWMGHSRLIYGPTSWCALTLHCAPLAHTHRAAWRTLAVGCLLNSGSPEPNVFFTGGTRQAHAPSPPLALCASASATAGPSPCRPWVWPLQWY